MEPIERWKQLASEVERFRRHLASDFPELHINHLYDFGWTQEQYKDSRRDKRYLNYGVYVFFDESGACLYVGQATFAFDKRIWKHPEIEGVRWIDAVIFPDTVWHFIPSLELYLICRLKPSHNKIAATYEVD